MLHRVIRGLGAVVLCGLGGPALASEPGGGGAGAIGDGDRVALVGAALVEQMQQHGYLESLLTTRHQPGRVQFRNFGWAGDTVLVQMRPLNFGDLESHLEGYDPTLAIVCYGMNESFEGAGGIADFVAGYGRILDMLGRLGARVAVVTPQRHEMAGPPLPDPAAHNRHLASYVQEVRKLAAQRGAWLVDLFDALPVAEGPEGPRLSGDGIHLTPQGYWLAALVIEQQLGYAARRWRVALAPQSSPEAAGTRLAGVEVTAEGARFSATDAMLPVPPPPALVGSGPDEAAGRLAPARELVVAGLAPGSYTLRVDGQIVARGDERAWAAGVTIGQGPQFAQVERLREVVNRKNRWFFYRWRAHNSEYIVGRRAAPAGPGGGLGNSGNPQLPEEMRQWDRLVSECEDEIARLAVPLAHRYALSRD